MSIIRKMLRYDVAVYWPPTANDRFGKPINSQPIELSQTYSVGILAGQVNPNQGVRWEDKQIMFLTKDGRSEVSKAIVYVGIDLELGGILWHGKMSDVVDLINPFNNQGAWEIRKFDKLPRIRNNEQLRSVIL